MAYKQTKYSFLKKIAPKNALMLVMSRIGPIGIFLMLN